MGHRYSPVDLKINDRNTEERNFLTLKSLRKKWRGREHVGLHHTHAEARED